MKKALANSLTYQTPKIVSIIDRKIGLIYYSICAVIISYILIYVLYYKQMAFAKEKTVGASNLAVTGKFIGKCELTGEIKVFDAGDLVRGTGGLSQLFIAARIDIISRQKIG
jgi:hypothetical protein